MERMTRRITRKKSIMDFVLTGWYLSSSWKAGVKKLILTALIFSPPPSPQKKVLVKRLEKIFYWNRNLPPIKWLEKRPERRKDTMDKEKLSWWFIKVIKFVILF